MNQRKGRRVKLAPMMPREIQTKKKHGWTQGEKLGARKRKSSPKGSMFRVFSQSPDEKSDKPFGIYVHIPYCLHKCPYCDFNTYAVSSIPEREYIDAVCSELDFRLSLPEWSERPVQSIYFGGGTPSIFQPASIGKVLTCISRKAHVSGDAEISMELNPGTTSADSITEFLHSGINRMSFGAQSFQAKLLKTLGRIHSPTDTVAAVEAARHAGCENLSLDLIYGVPGQTHDDFKDDIEKILALNPEHISAYGLTIEKGTPFFQQFRLGLLKLPDEDLIVEMMETLCQELPDAGLPRYEISNFSRPGLEARHNLAYWNGDDYLGIGAGAHSFSTCGSSSLKKKGVARWSNYALPNKYMQESTSTGHAESWSDFLKKDDRYFEFFFLGLRKIEGISLDDFQERFNASVYDVYPMLMKVLSQQGYLQTKDSMVSLTEKGLLFADTVIENFAEGDSAAPPDPTVVDAGLPRAANS
jgi:oxygen-independent coproporphyrinogen-3 oxidase